VLRIPFATYLLRDLGEIWLTERGKRALVGGSLHTEAPTAGKLAGDLFIYAAADACQLETFARTRPPCHDPIELRGVRRNKLHLRVVM
jgi:hypothetical protein